MEVSGRQARMGSYMDHTCNICSKIEQHVKALWFCKSCSSHLCDKCSERHRKDKQLSRHVLNRLSFRNTNDPLPPCEIHEDEEIKFYCRAHGVLGCMICMMTHKFCDTEYVKTASSQFLESDEFLNVERCLDDLKARYSENMYTIGENIKKVEKAYKTIIDEVSELKVNMIKRLDEIEQELHEEINNYKKTNEGNMVKLKAELDLLTTETVNTDRSLWKLKKENKDQSLFIEVKRAAGRIAEYHERIYEISTRNHVNEMNFFPTDNLDNILTRENLFGEIVQVGGEEGPCSSIETLETDRVSQINIKATNDKKTCHATGLAFLSPDYIAVADKANRNVKIIDVGLDKMISDLTLSSSPRDITLIPPDKLAVTLGDEEKIQLLSTTEGLKPTDHIKTGGKCNGIKHSQEKLIVTFVSSLSPKIEILSLSGETLCKFQFNNTEANLFKEPKRIGLSPNRCYMYVTDVGKMSISRCSLTGHIKNTSEGHRYMGVAVSLGGSVYTCSKTGDTVYKFSDDLSTVEPVLTTTDGIKAPIALAISYSRNMLYVSCGSGDARIANKLHVFKITPDN